MTDTVPTIPEDLRRRAEALDQMAKGRDDTFVLPNRATGLREAAGLIENDPRYRAFLQERPTAGSFHQDHVDPDDLMIEALKKAGVSWGDTEAVRAALKPFIIADWARVNALGRDLHAVLRRHEETECLSGAEVELALTLVCTDRHQERQRLRLQEAAKGSVVVLGGLG